MAAVFFPLQTRAYGEPGGIDRFTGEGAAHVAIFFSFFSFVLMVRSPH